MRFSIYFKHIIFILFLFASIEKNIDAQAGRPENSNPSLQKPKVKKSCGCPMDNIALEEKLDDEPLFIAEVSPAFVGGDIALRKYSERLIQNPALNASDSLKYTVLYHFIVEKDGSITHPEIIHHSDSIFESEALRFINTMPKWVPAKQDGKPVRCWHNINLYFGYPKK